MERINPLTKGLFAVITILAPILVFSFAALHPADAPASRALPADMDEAFAIARRSAVRIHSEAAMAGNIKSSSDGSGIIIGIGETIGILTCAHVIINDASSGYAVFADGCTAPYSVRFFSEESDIAVIDINASSIDPSTLSAIGVSALDKSVSETVSEGDDAFVIHHGENTADTYFKGRVISPFIYVESLGRYMMYLECDSWPGMSGGATYDAFGRVTGLLRGGTFDSETVGIPADEVVAVLEEAGVINR